ncbi:MAG: SDR family NAD(P)-dependent oxidoreductase [Parachlamydiaceae bacterium]|nr:SDR family NAD(P)-dependent oxidoreductase [Parachlamydiaceae bacterium]
MKTQEKFSLALVTGATSGIGKRLCELLAEMGIPIIIHGRDEEKLETVAKNLRRKVEVIPVIADLSSSMGQTIVATVIRHHVPDLVINNAGFGLYGEALTYDTARQLDILQVDGQATARFTLEAARALKNAGRKGVIMNISSAAAFPISPRFAMYSATKAFVNQFSESFDEEMRHHGVRILVACPGIVDTNFREMAGGRKLPGGEEVMTADFAAREILKQIEERKKMHVFNWYYRWLCILVRYILPKSFVAKIVQRRIQKLEHS